MMTSVWWKCAVRTEHRTFVLYSKAFLHGGGLGEVWRNIIIFTVILIQKQKQRGCQDTACPISPGL
jgi:hypothetical protein